MIETINILKDGNCLFRSIASSIHNNLFNAHRYLNGRLKLKNLSIIETELSKSLRFLVTNYLSRNKQKYINENIDGCSKFLDFDETYEEHLSRMKNDAEFGEFLEIIGISEMLNININIYSEIEGKPNLIFSTDKGGENINLLLSNEHYDILILKKNIKSELEKQDNINLNYGLRRSARIRKLKNSKGSF